MSLDLHINPYCPEVSVVLLCVTVCSIGIPVERPWKDVLRLILCFHICTSSYLLLVHHSTPYFFFYPSVLLKFFRETEQTRYVHTYSYIHQCIFFFFKRKVGEILRNCLEYLERRSLGLRLMKEPSKLLKTVYWQNSLLLEGSSLCSISAFTWLDKAHPLLWSIISFTQCLLI